MADRSKGKPDRGAKVQTMLGSLGALVVTYIAALLLTNLLIYGASCMITLPTRPGSAFTFAIALVLTVVFYLYDRRNP